MKIISRFTDFYDYAESVDRDDTVVYVREFSEVTLDSNATDSDTLILLIGEVQLTVTLKYTERRKFSHFFHNTIYQKPIGTPLDYSKVEKSLVEGYSSGRYLDEYFRCFSKETGNTNITSIDGELLLTPHLLEAYITTDTYSTIVKTVSTKLREELNITAPISLIYKKGIFNNFSIQASKLMPLVERVRVAAEIDNFLVRDLPIEVANSSDKVKIESKGLDFKRSFRHRK